MTIGIDPHKLTHSAVATDELGRQLAERTQPAKIDGFGALLVWARELDCDRVWVIEDCRHVSGPFERFLLDRGETVVRLPPQLMAGARDSVRERGKSDPIDALAVARAALREGIENLPTARLSGPELEIRLLAVHRERLVTARVRLDQRAALAAARPLARVGDPQARPDQHDLATKDRSPPRERLDRPRESPSRATRSAGSPISPARSPTSTASSLCWSSNTPRTCSPSRDSACCSPPS